MDAAQYDAWYRTPRGQWIGDVEFGLLNRFLEPGQGETLLDIGCGTGYFTHRFAEMGGLSAIGIDPNLASIRFARSRAVAGDAFVAGDGAKLPFPDSSFDRTVSVAALCFAREQRQFLSEMLRVTRKRFVLGLLNRAGLLYLRKGRHGGSGAYRGAHWHTSAEIHALLEGLPVSNVAIGTGVFFPSGGWLSRRAEPLLSGSLPWGSFMVVAGDRSR